MRKVLVMRKVLMALAVAALLGVLVLTSQRHVHPPGEPPRVSERFLFGDRSRARADLREALKKAGLSAREREFVLND